MSSEWFWTQPWSSPNTNFAFGFGVWTAKCWAQPTMPLLPWPMKGYPQSPRLTPEQDSFDFYLSLGKNSSGDCQMASPPEAQWFSFHFHPLHGCSVLCPAQLLREGERAGPPWMGRGSSCSREAVPSACATQQQCPQCWWCHPCQTSTNCLHDCTFPPP